MLITITQSGWYLIGATLLFLVIFIAFVLFFFKVKVKENNFIFVQQKIKALHEQTLLQTQLEIQEQTLKNISQEIHDNIGQVLSLVKININTMNCDEPDLLQGKIDDSKILISKAIQDLRDLSRSLNTDYVVEMGLARSIEYELELIKKTGSFETLFSIEGNPYRLEQQKELILFRIVQEVLHNIIKHAKASLITVALQFEPEKFVLTVADNGIGFDISGLKENNYAGTGLGIRNMHNRAKMINTDFIINSDLTKGTTITLTIPSQIQKN